ncbi:MAG: TonB-dependent receptor [Porticoccaceae bacterium]
MNRNIVSFVLAPCLGAVCAVPAVAQTPARALEEIVVTAQRRSESLQDVPISVSAFTGDALEKTRIVGTGNLAAISPGVVITTQQRSAQIFIRGIGSQSTNPGDEGNVAMYIDGVYLPSAYGNIFSFNNIDRVEVLKGPQGTLFGRNATGGLVHVITRDPSDVAQLKASINYGSYDTREIAVYGTAGTDTIAADLSVYHVHQGEGWGKSFVTGDEVNFRRETALRSKVLWTPTDVDRLTFSVDHGDNNSTIGLIRPPAPGAIMSGGFTNPGDVYDSIQNLVVSPSDVDIENQGVSLKYERELGDITFSVLSAYRITESLYPIDADNGPAFLFHFNSREKTRSFQNEFLLHGSHDRLDWTAGAFLYNAKTEFDIVQLTGMLPLPVLQTDNRRRQETDSYAVFAQGTYKLTDRTGLTVGLRYTEDERDLTARDVALPGHVSLPPGGVVLAREDSIEFEEVTWRLALDHQLTDDMLVYLSYNRGFKSGVFNLTAPGQDAVKPEILDAYEIGLKSELFDNRLRLNVAGFYYDYKDIQLTRNQAGVTFQFNAAEAEVYGLDVEALFVPDVKVGNLELKAGVTVLDTEYTHFPDAPFTVPNPAGGNTTTSGDATGHKLVRAPDVTFNIGLDYSIPVAEGTLGWNINYYYNDGYFFESDNRLSQPSYDVVNAVVSYSFGPGERYTLRAFAENLTDEEYYQHGSQGAFGDVVTPQPPRTLGIGFDFNLGG